MKVAVIGSQTLGTPTEIYEALYGNPQKIFVEGLTDTSTFQITNTYERVSRPFIKPLTRKERRKQARKRTK